MVFPRFHITTRGRPELSVAALRTFYEPEPATRSESAFRGYPLPRNKGGQSMVKKLLLAAAAFVTIGALGPATAVARAPVVLSGGGTGTFDGVHPGSQFGMGVVFR